MDILSTLRQPLSMSMFRNSDDLFAEMALQRQLAATEIESLRSRAEKAEAELLHSERFVQRLQAALAFWMPGVSEAIEIGTNGRAGDDAYLLAGFEGEVPSVSWGDKAHAKIAELEQAVAYESGDTNALAAHRALFARLHAVEATCEKLAAALEPFAQAAGSFDPPENDDGSLTWGTDFTLGDLRRARRALYEYRKEASNAG